MAANYTDPGPYKGGIWLVKTPDGKAGFYQRDQLPPPDGKTKYFWIGSSKKQINARLSAAMAALGVSIDQLPGGITGGQFGPSGTVQGLTGIPGTIASGISSVVDFLKLIGWIFHPRNLLRAVEFLAGIVLMLFGVWAAIQAYGEKREGFNSGESALSRSGLGRVARELASATPEGRAARMRAPHVTRRRARQKGLEAAAR